MQGRLRHIISAVLTVMIVAGVHALGPIYAAEIPNGNAVEIGNKNYRVARLARQTPNQGGLALSDMPRLDAPP
jgi:hypothetical protein